MEPCVGFKKPKIVLSTVLLPAPFGPISATISPSSTRSETPFRISSFP